MGFSDHHASSTAFLPGYIAIGSTPRKPGTSSVPTSPRSVGRRSQGALFMTNILHLERNRSPVWESGHPKEFHHAVGFQVVKTFP